MKTSPQLILFASFVALACGVIAAVIVLRILNGVF